MAVRTFSIRAGLDASTVTPGSTAPEVSFTTPAMLPAVACAAANVGKRNVLTRLAKTTRHTRRYCVLIPISFRENVQTTPNVQPNAEGTTHAITRNKTSADE